MNVKHFVTIRFDETPGRIKTYGGTSQSRNAETQRNAIEVTFHFYTKVLTFRQDSVTFPGVNQVNLESLSNWVALALYML